MPPLRNKKLVCITVEGCDYPVDIQEIPFREGVEARCIINGTEFRVSDRGLGEHEALRLLEEEVKTGKW